MKSGQSQWGNFCALSNPFSRNSERPDDGREHDAPGSAGRRGMRNVGRAPPASQRLEARRVKPRWLRPRGCALTRGTKTARSCPRVHPEADPFRSAVHTAISYPSYPLAQFARRADTNKLLACAIPLIEHAADLLSVLAESDRQAIRVINAAGVPLRFNLLDRVPHILNNLSTASPAQLLIIQPAPILLQELVSKSHPHRHAGKELAELLRKSLIVQRGLLHEMDVKAAPPVGAPVAMPHHGEFFA